MNEHMDKDKYSIGDLLWVKIGRYPFWPCMVSYDPNECCYTKLKKVGKKEVRIYHVQYFGKQVQHGWTNSNLILPYDSVGSYLSMSNDIIATAALKSPLRRKLVKKYYISDAIFKAWIIAGTECDVALEIDNLQKRYGEFVFKYQTDPKKPVSTKRKSVKKNESHKGKSVKKDENHEGESVKRNGSRKGRSNKPAKKAREASKIDEELCKLCEKGGVEISCEDCFQSFHTDCLGLICTPKHFKCFNCENGLFSCFVCQKADTSAVQCNKCIYYYHDGCLKKYACANYEKNICSLHICLTCHTENPRNVSSKGPFVQCIRCPTTFHATDTCMPVGCVKLAPSLIICSYHLVGKNKMSRQITRNVTYCSICSEGGELICCEACPKTYHVQCISEEVPDGDFFCEDCRQKPYLYIGMIVWAKTGNYRWWPAQIIRETELPENIRNINRDGEFPVQYFGTDEYIWTHRGRVIPYNEDHKDMSDDISLKPCKLTSQYKISLEEAAEAYDEYISEHQKQKPNAKPDAYRHIRVNRAVPPAQIAVLDTNSRIRCNCDPHGEKPCNSDSLCLNHSVLMECHPDMCLAGDRCENQKFQKRQYAAVKVIKTKNRGWGLITKQFICKGSFVIEYVGEIITHAEYRKRSEQMRDENIQNYYFLYLDSRRMIDAGPRGNLSRFINHSCSPNCQMEKWSVNGDLRIGIFAITDIQPGEELTFNYQSDSIQFEQKCNCGAENCRLFIGRNGIKHNGNEVKHNTKKQKLK